MSPDSSLFPGRCSAGRWRIHDWRIRQVSSRLIPVPPADRRVGALCSSMERYDSTCTQLTVAEISFRLGFQEPDSFFRAFHPWTGQTPERLRAAGTS